MRSNAIKQQREQFPTFQICSYFDVSRASFHAWLQKRHRPRKSSNQAFEVLVKTVYAEHHGRYGSPKIHRELTKRGVRVVKKRIEKTMRSFASVARKRSHFIKQASAIALQNIRRILRKRISRRQDPSKCG